ncbi:serine protease [Leptolyngbya sp. PCC 6406]|uniref:serine protease n=1 Tax=Leptolyngbya sp. PCC 6406 TaxID=1173264 RepID=UPI0002ACFE24|nr:serine protease [Leptolyngbya sp. PCC 6406]
MPSSRDRLLQHCTVKLVPANSSNWGTGFLVTPNHILTCAHVVAGYEVIPVWWRGQAWATARVEQSLPPPVDLALLQIAPTEGEQTPSVLLSETFNPFDRLYVYGYPDDFPDGGSVTIQCEGEVQEQGVTLIKAQAGQVRPGHSGSPALNWETGLVCGVVSVTRSRSTDLGGLLIPVSTVFSHFPDLQAQNQAAHPKDSLWLTLPLQSPAVSQPRSAVPPPQFSTYNPATFVGRTAETATLTACLQGSCRILAIAGMTGIGKTALAERVVANLMDAPLPISLSQGARDYNPVPLLPGEKGLGDEGNALPYYCFRLYETLSLAPDFANSGAALLRELGEEPTLADQQDPANLVEHILQRLHHQPCRLQIDSLERLLRGNEQEGWSEFCDPLWLDLLQKILAGTDCPSQLLLTSQYIPGDLDAVASRYPQFWHCEPLQGWTPDEQRTLFQNLGLTPTDTDWEILQRIGAFYDGHPLVLQVIAEEVRQRPFLGNIRQYWHHYEAEFTPTTPATATKLDRSRLFRRRVRQRVEQTLQRLPEPARQMLCASAVFRRPVPIEFWHAMLPDGDPQAAFDTLQDRHLVEYALPPNPSTHPPTPLLVRQHNLIRAVAYALLKAAPPIWEAAERQAAHLWLTEYQPAPDAPNLETVRGYLEAFEHFCRVEDWREAGKIAENRDVRDQLIFGGYSGFHKDVVRIAGRKSARSR